MKKLKTLPFALLLCGVVFATVPHKKKAHLHVKKHAAAAKTEYLDPAALWPDMAKAVREPAAKQRPAAADTSGLDGYDYGARHLEPQVGMYFAPGGASSGNPYGYAEPAAKAKRKKN